MNSQNLPMKYYVNEGQFPGSMNMNQPMQFQQNYQFPCPMNQYDYYVNPMQQMQMMNMMQMNQPFPSQQTPQMCSSEKQEENLEEKLLKRQQIQEELIDVLEYLIKNVGKINTNDLFKKKKELKILVKNNECKVFDMITSKYLTSKKTKEEMIKFILRKCFKFIKQSIQNQDMQTQKELDEDFMQQYFQGIQFTAKELQEANSTSKEDLLMPFRKNSKIKTMNSSFLKIIFNSDKFYHDYQKFLDKFDEIAQNENGKKLKKCSIAITQLIEKENFQKIKNYKRLPWTEKWLEETKSIAFSLIKYATKTKKQDSPSSDKNAQNAPQQPSANGAPLKTVLSQEDLDSHGEILKNAPKNDSINGMDIHLPSTDDECQNNNNNNGSASVNNNIDSSSVNQAPLNCAAGQPGNTAATVNNVSVPNANGANVVSSESPANVSHQNNNSTSVSNQNVSNSSPESPQNAPANQHEAKHQDATPEKVGAGSSKKNREKQSRSGFSKSKSKSKQTQKQAQQMANTEQHSMMPQFFDPSMGYPFQMFNGYNPLQQQQFGQAFMQQQRQQMLLNKTPLPGPMQNGQMDFMHFQPGHAQPQVPHMQPHFMQMPQGPQLHQFHMLQQQMMQSQQQQQQQPQHNGGHPQFMPPQMHHPINLQQGSPIFKVEHNAGLEALGYQARMSPSNDSQKNSAQKEEDANQASESEQGAPSEQSSQRQMGKQVPAGQKTQRMEQPRNFTQEGQIPLSTHPEMQQMKPQMMMPYSQEQPQLHAQKQVSTISNKEFLP